MRRQGERQSEWEQERQGGREGGTSTGLRNVNQSRPTPFQGAAIFISHHVIHAARVVGGLQCPVRPGPQGGWVFTWRVFNFLTATKQEAERKTKKIKNDNKWREGLVCKVCQVTWRQSVLAACLTARPGPARPLPSADLPAPPPATQSSPPSSGSWGVPRKTRQ